MSLTSVCWEAEGAARSPAEDKPVSPGDMTRLSAAQRISALPVNIIAEGRGAPEWGEGGRGKREKWRYCFDCAILSNQPIV